MAKINTFEAFARLLTFPNQGNFDNYLRKKELLFIYKQLKQTYGDSSFQESREFWNNERRDLPLENRIQLLIKDAIDFYKNTLINSIDENNSTTYVFSSKKDIYTLKLALHLESFKLSKKEAWEPRNIDIKTPAKKHINAVSCFESDIKCLLRSEGRKKNKIIYGPNLEKIGKIMDQWHGEFFINNWSSHNYKVYEGNIQLLNTNLTIPIVVSFDAQYSEIERKQLITAKIETDSSWKFKTKNLKK